MATRNSTGKTRPDRNRQSSKAKTAQQALADPLEEPIEAERTRLWRAHALLGCLHFSLLYGDGETDVLSLSDVAKVAEELIAQTIERLDSVHIGKLTGRLPAP